MAGICGGVSEEDGEGRERYLFYVPAGETDDDGAAVPGDAFEGRDDHSDGVVDAVMGGQQRPLIPRSTSPPLRRLDHSKLSPQSERTTHTSAPLPLVISMTFFCHPSSP